MTLRNSLFLTFVLLISFGLAACTGGTPAIANPAAPAAEGGGGEGGGGEAPRGPTLTNPGGLPAPPEKGNNSQSQMGEEHMIKVEDPAGQFSILFVETWKQETANSNGALRSMLNDLSAEVEIVPSQGQTPLQAAQSVDSSQGNGSQGYERLAIQEGDVHGLPAASVIYIHESGKNPVTDKPLRFISSEIFVGGGPSDQLGHLTFSAPYTSYGELSEIFDKVLAGFTWR